MEKEKKKRKGGAEKEREKKRRKLHDIATKRINIQEVFAKVSSSLGSQMKSVNSAMHELDKNQSANCSVHNALILDSQDSFNSKIITPPSVSATIAPPSVSKTFAPQSSQHQLITAASVSETLKHSWFVNLIKKNAANISNFTLINQKKLNSIVKCLFST